MLFEAADQQPEIALERIISGLSALKNEPWNTYRVLYLLQSKMISKVEFIAGKKIQQPKIFLFVFLLKI